MSRVTLKGLNRIAEDHNKHNANDDWNWKDVIYEECLCGNNVKTDFDRMSKKETLKVLDWASWYRFDEEIPMSAQLVYRKIYDAAFVSLMERL